ncbi:unnamed protein product [Bursaphelenchus xylophilus]|uniref:(pine wood nematode) hypothetical protein n=1 Tax=Bursaphelenchus xylophilus TaxID=6326 RepID=A0A1I7SRU6_BURXY|nr:unnamed protein product [Bursaphelenchus xylophilus]CAG9101838.1 unnamed protein product [Bursaphelenchus xylophilus]
MPCCGSNCGKNRIADEVVDNPKSSIGRVLIFVNPKSGAGAGSKVYQKAVRPVLLEKKLAFETIITEHQNHAAKILGERRDLETFAAIVIVSGDGLIFEALNAILSRSDASILLDSLPFFIIPCGSGNGLLSSVYFRRKIAITPAKQLLETATESLVYKWAISVPVTLMHCRVGSREFGAFLSVGWGLMGDIDIESESLRPICGGQRFVFGALWRVASLRKYRARLSFLQFEAEEAPPVTSAYSRSVYEQKERNLNPITEEGSEPNVWSGKLLINEPETDAPVPHGWRTIEDDFVNVYAVTRSHISQTNIFAPDAQLEESAIHLCYLLNRDIHSKTQLVKFLTAIEQGEHLNLPFVHYLKVKAFRLEALAHHTHKSPIVVDGEVIPDCSQIQCISSTLAMRVATK